jgi:hypothetical protein
MNELKYRTHNIISLFIVQPILHNGSAHGVNHVRIINISATQISNAISKKTSTKKRPDREVNSTGCTNPTRLHMRNQIYKDHQGFSDVIHTRKGNHAT